MPINSIVALSEQIQKLHIEKASAAVLRDHLSFFKDQAIILEKKLASLESENSVLKAENAEFQANFSKLKKEIDDLKKKIQPQNKPAHDDSLPKEQEQILLFLAANSDQMFSSNTIMLECGLSDHKALYHIKKLEDAFLITSEFTDGEDYYSIDDDGRAYLVEHELIA